MKKRIISLILALALCVGMLPAPVFAEEAPGAQTLEKEVVSQNEEPQPEPAPQNEEGQEPQGEPEQGEPQEEPQGEPQEEPEQEEPPVQSVLKANAPMAVAEGENGEEVTLTVGEQNGKLFDGVNSAATFPVTCENGNLNSLKITFSPENSDLTAAVSEDGTTVTVMTAGNAKAGIYQMTLALGQTSQTVSVIVDVPFTIKNREIQVASDQTSATLTLEVDVAPELEGQVQYIWMPDGKNSVVTNTNTVTLCPDNLKQDENSPGRYSAWVDCRVSCGTYFGTATRKFVKIIACDHLGAILYTKEGTCRGCGQLCPEDRPFITEDGVAIQIAQNANTPFALDDWFPGTLYLWEDYTRGTDLDVGTLDGNGTLELQNHNVYSKLILDDFQGHSFKIYDGYLTQLTLNQAGSLILENVTIENPLTVPAGTDLEIKKNVEFKNRVSFNGPAKLTGGTFNAGLSHQDEQDEPHSCLELLAPGYAFADGNKEIIDASRESISGKVQVVSHPTCTYKADKAGKCDCGRSCPHESLNEQGYCTVCKMLVEPFAIGEQGYRSLEEAQTAAQEGQTIYLRGDYELPNPVVISKNITLDVCGYTLSGSSENALLQITGTDVTVQKGDIWNTQAPAVTVKSGANLTVKTASFGGGSDHVLVVEQGGRADVHNGGFLHGVLYVDGSLDMEGCFQANLKLGPNVGKISIVEGNFDSITLAGGKEYKDLLAEGSAYWADGAWVKLVEAQEKTPVVIAECPHQDGLAGSQACPYCGKTCGHGNMDQETGCCKDCGYQVYKAKVDERMKYTFQEAMDAAQAGKTVTLLADDSLGGNLTLDKKITLNINGCTLKTRYFTVQAPLTICGGGEIESDFSFNAQVTVQGTRLKAHKGVVEKGGSLCIDQGATVNLVSVFPGGSLELKQGTVGILYVADGGKARLSSGTVTQKLEMEKGNILSILPQGKALEKDGKIVNGNESNVVGPVTVVDHTHMFDGSTTCPCGYTVAATLDTEAGKQYFADFGDALEAAKAASGSTLTLLRDVALTGENNLYIDSGTFTIDWNGHTISGEMSNVLLCITDAAKVTLTDSIGTGGVRNVRGAAIGAYVGSPGSLTIQGGVYSPQLWKDRTAYGPIRISGGRFESPEDSGRNGALYCYSGVLADLLAPGCTFAYEDDDSLFDVYQRKSEIYRTVYVVEHQQHEFDDEGQCLCGYVCPHTQVDEAGACKLCGKRFYVRGTYADGTTHYYGTLSDALEDPAVTQAVMIRPYVPVCESWNGGDRSVTLDLNGIAVVVKSIQGGHLILRDSSGSDSILGMAEILKDGQVTLESGSIYPQGETLSVYGKLTVTGGYVDSLTAMEGSTVSLSGGEVDSLTAIEGSTVSLSGGSFGKIVGSGVTLKELLAEDCYYAELDGETPKDYADTDTVLEQVSVVVCDHTSVREIDIGYGRKQYKCNCGQVTYLLTVTVGESDKKYFGDYNTGFAYAAETGGVVRFLELNGTIEVNAQGMVTIDMENRSYSAYDRSLVIKSGSTVQLVGQGWQSSAPEAGSGSSSSGKLEYSEFIPVTVESGGTFVLPANNLNGEPNMAKPTQLTVQSGGTAELQGGSTQWTDVHGTLKISGGSHWYIHQYEMGQLNITGGQIQLLQIYGDLPQNALSGGSYVTISVMEFRSGETEKFRDVTFADFQKMLVSGKVFQKKQDQSYPNEVEETPNYGTFNYSKELKNVNVTAAPFTGVQVVCQLGNTEHSGSVTTVYGGQEEDFFLKARLLSPAAEDQSVTYQWYQVQDGSKTEVGKDETYQLKQPINVGVYTYQVTASCNGYELTSDPFTVTVGKAPQTADVEAHDETVSGKNDGYVTLKPLLSAYEMRKQGEETFTACEGAGTKLPLPAGTYEIRMKETKNYNSTPAETVTIGAGPKLTVTLPSPQTGYSLTADKQELGWHDSVRLTLTLETGYYRTASLAVKAGDRVLTEDKGTYTLTNVEENLTITLEGVEKDEKAPSLVLRNWIFGRGAFQGWATNRDWENISTATAPYYIISTRGNYFAVVASDGETGLASASYLLSKTALTREALEQAAWEPVPEESLNQASPDREKMIQLGLGEWYFYVKAVDKAGNVSYVGSDKLIREENAPTFSGVTNGAAYYTTQKVTITDDYALSRYLAPESQNWKNISGTSYEVTLEGNREGTYTMEAEDACQNTSTLTVYMKPISSLTEDIRNLTEDNVCKSDLDQLTQAEKALKALDTTNATDEEKKTITEALDSIGTLKAILEEVTRVEAMIAALPDSVEPYQQTVEDTQIKPARQAYSDLTDHQKTLVDSAKLDKLVRLEAQLDAWTITEGDGQTWFKGSWNPLSFTVNGQTQKFSKVLLDGKMYITATPSFLAVSGSTDEPFTLTLKPEFLQVSMEPGEHTLTVIYGENNSRTGTVTFTVEIPANYLDVTNKPEFDGKTTVTVDGAEYPIEEMNGTRYVNLPETGDLLTIYSFKDGTPAGSYTNYPTGMQVFRITRQEGGAKAEEITEFANLLNYAGCSIRLTGTKGIRMITGISENARTALIGAQGLAGYTLEEYGTVVMRGVGTPTLENSKSHNFAYKKGKADPIFSRANGMIQYTNVLVGFSLEDCKDTLTLRPYIKLKNMTNGETVTLYGGCVSRSIGYIAKQNENTYKPGTAGYKYIHEIIDAVYGKTEQGGETK